MSDPRPWRTKTLRLPEPVAVRLESSIELLKIAGKATNDIEAIEAMCAGVWEEELHGLLADAKHHAETAEKMARWCALFNAGWRCLICGTSRDLQCHHMTPRSQGGVDDERNLAVLCEADHRRITENQWPWRDVGPWLEKAKIERLREINTNGIASKRDRTGDLARYLGVGGDSLQAKPDGADCGGMEHPKGAEGVRAPPIG